MTPAWTKLYGRSLDIALAAPEVVARRLLLMQPPSLWAPATLFEMQRMWLEKAAAAAEASWALYRAAWSVWPAPGWTSAHPQRLADHAARSVHRALAPVSRRVKANARRLRR